MGRHTVKQRRYIKLKRKLKKLQEMIEQGSPSTQSSCSSDSESEIEKSHRLDPKQGPSRRFFSSDSEDEAPQIQTVSADVENINSNNKLGDEMSKLLGDDPSTDTSLGPPLQEGIASRWNSYILNGLEKDTREKLNEKWKIPENCEFLAAPKMNVETESLLPSIEKKKDAILGTFQDKIGKGLGAIGQVLNKLLTNDVPEEVKNELSPVLADAGKMFCEIHYLISKHRKHQVYPLFNQSVQKVAEGTKSDRWLFGAEFGEKCKAAQNIQKVSSEMSVKIPKKTPQRKASAGTFFYRRQVPRVRFKHTDDKERRRGRFQNTQKRQQNRQQYRQ